MITEKFCKKCQTTLPISSFGIWNKSHSHSKDGLSYYCKPCNSKAKRELYAASRDDKTAHRRAAWGNKQKAKAKIMDTKIKTERPAKWRTLRLRSNCSKQITEDWLLATLELQSGKCALSGRAITILTAEVDHITPKSRGGTDDLSNLRLLSHEANRCKGNMLDTEFMGLCSEIISFVSPTILLGGLL